MTRIKAAIIHFLISTTLAAIVIGMIVFGWYKLPYFWAIGGPMLLALIVGVDVILGPLMTLILFNPAKSRRELTLDLTIIAAVQASALVYGVHAAYASRVLYEVYAGGEFHLVKANDLLVNDAALPDPRRPEYVSPPLINPMVVGVKSPDDPKGKSDFGFYTILHATHLVPAFYVPLNEVVREMTGKGLPPEKLGERNAGLRKLIDVLLKQSRLGWQDVAVFPFKLPQGYYTAVIDIRSGKLVKVISQSPYGPEKVAGS